MMQGVVEWMGSVFPPEQYVFWTRIQCSAWTLADILIVYYLLRLANLARLYGKAAPHRICYALWFATIPPAATIPFLTSGSRIFLVELCVTVPHFLIILYVLAADTRNVVSALSLLISSTRSASSGRPC